MQKFLYILLVLSFFSCKKDQNQAPNIIYILADDLGYGELGIFGQKYIKTPNIDALAKEGMILTDHYTAAPVCAPARCMLLTGMHAGHAYIRGNDEWKERGDVWNYKKVYEDPGLEGQRPIPDTIVTLAEKLKSAGYTTGIFGKWGLGAPNSEGTPNKQGFDEFFGYNCQRQAHNLYPSHLWENDKKVILKNELVVPHTKLDSLTDHMDDNAYAKFTQVEYAPEIIHDKAMEFINKNQSNPFFLFYASPLPHLPLQIPKAELKKYQLLFKDEIPYNGNSYFPTKYPRSTYAAMITYLDKQVGELVETLKEKGLYENTLIIFSSDNGPTYTGGVDFDYFESSKPFSNGYGRTKGFVHEGGIRVPMIASWPNHISPGSTSDLPSAFYDILPTLCDIVGVSIPDKTDGISFKPTLLGQTNQELHEFLYWEFPSYKGQQAVRIGDWKGIRKNIFEGNMEIELYNIKQDLLETNNFAEIHPGIVRRIEDIMKQEHRQAQIEKFRIKELGDY